MNATVGVEKETMGCGCGAGWDEIINQRPWPEFELVIGECERCGSTISRPWVAINGEEEG